LISHFDNSPTYAVLIFVTLPGQQHLFSHSLIVSSSIFRYSDENLSRGYGFPLVADLIKDIQHLPMLLGTYLAGKMPAL